MKCTVNDCRGTTDNRTCSLHGPTCDECGLPCLRVGDKQLCWRDEARANGVICSVCSSPWVYIGCYDGRNLCRMCMINMIRENGWDQDSAKLQAAMKRMEEERQEKLKKTAASNEKITERLRKISSRAKATTEVLFENEEKK